LAGVFGPCAAFGLAANTFYEFKIADIFWIGPVVFGPYLTFCFIDRGKALRGEMGYLLYLSWLYFALPIGIGAFFLRLIWTFDSEVGQFIVFCIWHMMALGLIELSYFTAMRAYGKVTDAITCVIAPFVMVYDFFTMIMFLGLDFKSWSFWVCIGLEILLIFAHEGGTIGEWATACADRCAGRVVDEEVKLKRRAFALDLMWNQSDLYFFCEILSLTLVMIVFILEYIMNEAEVGAPALTWCFVDKQEKLAILIAKFGVLSSVILTTCVVGHHHVEKKIKRTFADIKQHGELSGLSLSGSFKKKFGTEKQQEQATSQEEPSIWQTHFGYLFASMVVIIVGAMFNLGRMQYSNWLMDLSKDGCIADPDATCMCGAKVGSYGLE
jgi:hypothetical protein